MIKTHFLWNINVEFHHNIKMIQLQDETKQAMKPRRTETKQTGGETEHIGGETKKVGVETT